MKFGEVLSKVVLVEPLYQKRDGVSSECKALTSNRGPGCVLAVFASRRVFACLRVFASRRETPIARPVSRQDAKTRKHAPDTDPRTLAAAHFALRDLQPAVTSDTVPIREQRYEIKSNRDHYNCANDQFFFLRR